MPKVAFTGRVFPACYEISLTHQNSLDWIWQDENLTLHFDVAIQKSLVRVDCALDRFKPEYVDEIHKRSLDLVRSAVNLVGFCSGVGYTVIFDRFIDTLGKESMIAPEDRSLAPLCNSFSLTSHQGKTAIGTMWDLVVADPALFQALDDLIVSITLPHHSPVNCARAVEGLRNLIATPGVSVSHAWEQMRNALRLEREFLQLITETATAPRHGDRGHIPGAITTEIVRRSWIVMDRFLEYRKRGNTPLPAADFPMAVG